MSAASAAMTCPHCHVPLTMSERQGIEIDYCPQCRGIWLDRGELDKIIERAARDLVPPAPTAPEPPPRPYGTGPVPGYAPDPGYRPDPRYRDDDYKRHKRPKSWIEDIFD